MLVSELLNNIRSSPEYMSNSLILKSYNEDGCTYKYLLRRRDLAVRKEIFIATGLGDVLEARTVIDSIEVSPAE